MSEALLGPETPAGARLENIARLLGLVSETIDRAAVQGRDILFGKPEPAAEGAETDAGDGDQRNQ